LAQVALAQHLVLLSKVFQVQVLTLYSMELPQLVVALVRTTTDIQTLILLVATVALVVEVVVTHL
jgi:hypothetical protein